MDIKRSRLGRTGLPRVMAAGLALIISSSCGGPEPIGPDPDPDPDPENTAPVAAAGADQTVSATLPVTVDGSASTDADGDAITYAWSFTARPTGSQAEFDDATAAATSFTPDVAGAYTAQLVVSDGTDSSDPDAATITAEDNTTTETVGAGGGQVVSSDGKLSLEIPAGALAADEEISITKVSLGQRTGGLEDLDDDVVVYDMKPDGLQFAVPVRVDVSPPEGSAPDPDDEGSGARLGMLVTLSDGELEIASDQEIVADASEGTITASGTIEHFSDVWWMTAIDIDGAPATLTVEAFGPFGADVGDPFLMQTVVTSKGIGAPDATIGATLTDLLEDPVVLEGTLNGTLAQNPEATGFELEVFNQYRCTADGIGQWGADVTVTGLRPWGPEWEAPEVKPIALRSTRTIVCKQELPTFAGFDATAPEAQSDYRQSALHSLLGTTYGREGGVTLTDLSGATIASYDGLALAGTAVWGALAFPDDGVIAHTPTGLFVNEGPVPTEPTTPAPELDLTIYGQPATGPDMSTNITDAVTWDTPSSSGVTTVHFANGDIAFFTLGSTTGGAPGFDFDESLAEAFKPGGTSVFGAEELPVTAYVRPGGWTEDNRMLVGTIHETTGASTLWTVERDGNVAVPTAVTAIGPADDMRKVRCLESICAVTANGSGFGFGSTVMFHWDGTDVITPIQGLSGRSVGVDLMESEAGTVHIAHTLYQNGFWWVHEISKSGEYLDGASGDVPEGCTGAGHASFRTEGELILSCNSSNNVVSQPYTLPSGG